MDYRVLKLLNESTLLLVTPIDRKHKTNINDVKPCTTLELIEIAWNSFLNSIKLHTKIMIISGDLVTYKMNSITTTSLPTHIKYLHHSSEVGQHYTHEFNTGQE